MANGFDTDLWTLERVTVVITQLTGVRYHPGHVWVILRHRLGWTLQRPERRASERDEQALAEFERDLIRERTTAGLAAARARGPPRRPATGDDRPQAPGGPGDVPLWAVHGGSNRQDPWRKLGLDLPASLRRHELTKLS